MPSRSILKGQRRYRLDKLELPALEEIEPKARRKIMRAAVRVLALEVRRVAPDSGKKHKRKLKKSVRYDVMDGGKTGRVKLTAPHAHLVHDGTKPHGIVATSRSTVRSRILRRPLLRYFSRSGLHIQHSTRHPGIRKPNPFLVEAGERMRPQMEQVMREGIGAALDEVV